MLYVCLVHVGCLLLLVSNFVFYFFAVMLFQVFERLEFFEDLLQLDLSSEEVCKWVWLVDGLEGVV